ncbi:MULTISPECIES: hypothetical protein [unclassified Ruegeria]|uniref:hypothetical protein n=1 Tax=unclassified Ruegeria TaxID=2625375 RepID=UPI001487C136|nr:MULTISPECIES: hypothetical protein [unclassified Ruegeria]
MVNIKTGYAAPQKDARESTVFRFEGAKSLVAGIANDQPTIWAVGNTRPIVALAPKKGLHQRDVVTSVEGFHLAMDVLVHALPSADSAPSERGYSHDYECSFEIPAVWL